MFKSSWEEYMKRIKLEKARTMTLSSIQESKCFIYPRIQLMNVNHQGIGVHGCIGYKIVIKQMNINRFTGDLQPQITFNKINNKYREEIKVGIIEEFKQENSKQTD